MAIDAPIELQHVFRLTNESGATLHLQRIATTCGCTKAEASSATVAPGAIVEITVRMKVATAGMKREEIRLICTEVEPIVLTLSATVTIMESFYTAVQTVVVAPNEPARVLAVQLRRDDVAPGVLRCEAPAGISACATEWTQVVRSNPQAGRPSRWHAWVRIEQLEQVSMTGNAVTVIDSLGRTERIALDGHLPG